MPTLDRTTLAFIEGFRRPAPARAQGTLQSAHLICQALANVGRYSAFDVYQDRGRNPAVYGELALPRTPPTRVFEKTRLPVTRDRYSAIHVANGDQSRAISSGASTAAWPATMMTVHVPAPPD